MDFCFRYIILTFFSLKWVKAGGTYNRAAKYGYHGFLVNSYTVKFVHIFFSLYSGRQKKRATKTAVFKALNGITGKIKSDRVKAEVLTIPKHTLIFL